MQLTERGYFIFWCGYHTLWAASPCTDQFSKHFSKTCTLHRVYRSCFILGCVYQIFTGGSINALTEPLPFYAYPFFAATLFGWGWIY
jgi:hypothetical protein